MVRKYGNANILVLHGGPGAIGGARALARELEAVEVLHYGQSIEAQLGEIDEVIQALEMRDPVIIGHSWGAWLAYMYAARRPIGKIILIGCGAFDQSYLGLMQERREGKLTGKEQQQADRYFEHLKRGKSYDLPAFNRLMTKMDAYEPIAYETLDAFDFIGHGFLMEELNKLRRSGELLEMGKEIQGKISIIHGLEDPHPLEGVTEPFDRSGIAYTLHTLERCGHIPWHERYGKDPFYQALQMELFSHHEQ